MRSTSHSHLGLLPVLIANEKRDRLDLLAQVVIGLGHDVIAREISSGKSAQPQPGSAPTEHWRSPRSRRWVTGT